MPRNSHFQFKQFIIRQDRCAMKVCTDACVFGAWIDVEAAERILDIGAGTGLLSLMAAQRSSGAVIHAVEIDPDAAAQALENKELSPYGDRIKVVNTAIQEFTTQPGYDLIITNPPFFQGDLRSPNHRKNGAHHAEFLTFEELLQSVDRLLKPEGRWAVLLPPDESAQLADMALRKGWITVSELLLYHEFTRKPLRRMTTFARKTENSESVFRSEIAIFEFDGKTHTVAFRKLLQDFYLNF